MSVGRSGLVERLLDVRDAAYVLGGLTYYGLRRTTPKRAYHGMVRLFCRGGGRTNDLISRGVAALRPPVALASSDGVLGSLEPQSRTAIAEALERDGYFVFDQRLSDSLCDRLLELAVRTPSLAQNADGADDKLLAYERNAPRAVRYELQPADLLGDPTIQDLIADWSILTVAQDYLKTAPILDIVTMWWHTAFRDAPDARAAQYYHFDMDRPRWLKFFFYLTDVGPENGPHCFIRGSHRTGGIAAELLARGYARLDDADVANHYSAEDHIVFTGRRGTIIAEDTRGLHKGQHVVQGDRLVFQLEFTNTLFGGQVAEMVMPVTPTDALRERQQTYPRLYSALETSR